MGSFTDPNLGSKSCLFWIEFWFISIPKCIPKRCFLIQITAPNASPTQASTAWRWWNFYAASVPLTKGLLRLNLDETALCLHPGAVPGNVFPSKKRPREFANQVPLGTRRCYATHVGIICDRTDVQPLLPQVVVVNQRTVRRRPDALPGLKAACPANVYLVRQQSAWNNASLLSWIIGLLGAALRPYLDEFQPILLLDTVKFHWSKQVLAACRAARIWPVYVPAGLTWLLQPLDTHAFRLYKAFLREAHADARATARVGDLPIAEFLQCVYRTIRKVLQGNKWAAAFDANGFGDRQAHVSGFVRRQLQLDAPLAVPTARPSDAAVGECFPSNAHVPFEDLWRTMQPILRVPAVARLPRCGLVPRFAPPSEHRILPGRLRSGRSWGPAGAAAASSSSAAAPPPAAG